MCDRLGKVGEKEYYICDRCFEQLVAMGPTADIVAFMNGAGMDLTRARLNKIFPIMQGSPKRLDW